MAKRPRKEIDPLQIRLICMNQYIRPDVKETPNKEWVLNGRDNSFYEYIIDRYNGSPTNATIINSYIDLIYGRGLDYTNGERAVADWLKFNKMLSKTELKRIIYDFALFGEASMQIIKANNSNKVPTIYHIPKEKTLPQKKNKDGEIEGYYYADNWSKVRTDDDVDFFEAFGIKESGKANEVYVIRPYKAGKGYFSDPEYLPGLPYAEMEEEIANYYLSHIKNGLSFGYIINIPDGNSYSPEEKDEIEKKIVQKLTGSPNAGKFLINFNGRDAKIEITPIEVADAHSQWTFLVGEARQQLMTAHRVTSPMLFGIKDSTGLGNNADELDTAEAQLMKRVIQPRQQYILDALMDVAAAYDLNLDLIFKPLTEQIAVQGLEPHVAAQLTLSDIADINRIVDSTADFLVDLGEDIDDLEWELVESRDALGHTLSEDLLYDEIKFREYEHIQNKSFLDKLLSFAKAPKSSPITKTSRQDTSLFKVRYHYAGNKNPEREFCRKIMAANKGYRVEDLEAASHQVVNEGMGKNGSNTYDIFKYKGGVNCKHFWERRIYLKRNNKRISVNEARRMILELEPNERKAARWEQNPSEVARSAESLNNFWKYKKK